MDQQQLLLLVLTVLATAINLILLVLRICARYVSRLHFWWDDWLLLFGAVNLAAMHGLSVSSVYKGMGRHEAELSVEAFTLFGKIAFVLAISYGLAMCAIKASLLLFYYRLFERSVVLKRIAVPTLVCVLVWGISFTVARFVRCTPWSAETSAGQARCSRYVKTVLITQAATNILTGVICLVAPVAPILALKVSKGTKISLLTLFALGGMDVIFSVGRLGTVIVAEDSSDPTYAALMSVVWTVLELSMALNCACLPGIKPIFNRFRTKKPASKRKMRGLPKESDTYAGTEQSTFTTRVFSEKKKSWMPDIEEKEIITRLRPVEAARPWWMRGRPSPDARACSISGMSITVTTDIELETENDILL